MAASPSPVLLLSRDTTYIRKGFSFSQPYPDLRTLMKYLTESEVFKASEPGAKSARSEDGWHTYDLTNVTITGSDGDRMANLLEAEYQTSALIVTGVLDSTHVLQARRTQTSGAHNTQATRIMIRTNGFAIGDPVPTIWIRGDGRWFTMLQPSEIYESMYLNMAESAELYYAIEHVSGEDGDNLKTPNELFCEISEFLGTGIPHDEFKYTLRSHAPFLLSQMSKTKSLAESNLYKLLATENQETYLDLCRKTNIKPQPLFNPLPKNEEIPRPTKISVGIVRAADRSVEGFDAYCQPVRAIVALIYGGIAENNPHISKLSLSTVANGMIKTFSVGSKHHAWNKNDLTFTKSIVWYYREQIIHALSRPYKGVDITQTKFWPELLLLRAGPALPFPEEWTPLFLKNLRHRKSTSRRLDEDSPKPKGKSSSKGRSSSRDTPMKGSDPNSDAQPTHSTRGGKMAGLRPSRNTKRGSEAQHHESSSENETMNDAAPQPGSSDQAGRVRKRSRKNKEPVEMGESDEVLHSDQASSASSPGSFTNRTQRLTLEAEEYPASGPDAYVCDYAAMGCPFTIQNYSGSEGDEQRIADHLTFHVKRDLADTEAARTGHNVSNLQERLGVLERIRAAGAQAQERDASSSTLVRPIRRAAGF